jgi:hypothetical protein
MEKLDSFLTFAKYFMSSFILASIYFTSKMTSPRTIPWRAERLCSGGKISGFLYFEKKEKKRKGKELVFRREKSEKEG